MKIRSTFYGSEKMNPIDMIRLDKIKILGCEGHADSSYIETIEMSFNVCSINGLIIGANTDNRFRIVFDIETGYLPEDAIEKQLKKLLESFKIYDIETLLQAFRYRRFYCKL